MPRNIEIKARVHDIDALRTRAAARADAPAVCIEQHDTFFRVPQGRLKLRRFADGSAELIHYQRPDHRDAKASDYVRVPVADAAALQQALVRANGLLGEVRKTRWLLLRGRTRIHLDRVDGLGDFVELEVVLRDGEADADGVAEAEALMRELGLHDAERLAGAYLELPARDGAGAAPTARA